MARRERLAERFRGRHAIVTGGSGGIGLAIARRLVELGASVTLVARDAEKLERAAAGLGAGADTLALDLSDPEAVARELPGERTVDLLVNCAGIATVAEFMDLAAEDLRREMDVNYFGAVWATRAVLPRFLERGQGHVVIVGSTASLVGIHGYGAYAPAKFALYGLAEVLRAELAPRGVGVTIVMPTSTRTPMFEREVAEAPPQTAAIITARRVLEPAEVAEATVRAVARGRFEVIPGRDVALSTRAYRMLPAIGRRVVDRDARKGAR
ncbi:MAG TPA: SDR family oxidoreductase [Thermoleophilaceae bacterium]|jgi:3-dehydrosphinganine reductase